MKIHKIIEDLFKKAGIRIISDSKERVILPTDIQLDPKRLTEFYKRLYNDPLLSFGEMYMQNVWSTNDLIYLFSCLYQAGLNDTKNFPKSIKRNALRKFIVLFLLDLLSNLAKKRPFEIGQKHYDIGNDLYEVMLGPSMTYSCGLWLPGVKNLEQAQIVKFERACQNLSLHYGMRVLDIGCGFGSFAKYAANNYDVEVVGITVSKEQADFANKYCKGLPVEVLVQDYRKLTGQFDAIASFGMFEHVCPRNYKEFFNKCANLLKPDGKLFLHTIASHKKVWVTDPYIRKWIFPNSYIPTEFQTILHSIGYFTYQKIYHVPAEYYAKTLKVWYQNFKNGWSTIENKYRLPEYSFYKSWEFYLCSCVALFEANKKYVLQILFEKK